MEGAAALERSDATACGGIARLCRTGGCQRCARQPVGFCGALAALTGRSRHGWVSAVLSTGPEPMRPARAPSWPPPPPPLPARQGAPFLGRPAASSRVMAGSPAQFLRMLADKEMPLNHGCKRRHLTARPQTRPLSVTCALPLPAHISKKSGSSAHSPFVHISGIASRLTCGRIVVTDGPLVSAPHPSLIV